MDIPRSVWTFYVAKPTTTLTGREQSFTPGGEPPLVPVPTREQASGTKGGSFSLGSGTGTKGGPLVLVRITNRD